MNDNPLPQTQPVTPPTPPVELPPLNNTATLSPEGKQLKEVNEKLDELIDILKKAYPPPGKALLVQFGRGMVSALGAALGSSLVFLLVGYLITKLVIVPYFGPMFNSIKNLYGATDQKSTINAQQDLLKQLERFGFRE